MSSVDTVQCTHQFCHAVGGHVLLRHLPEEFGQIPLGPFGDRHVYVSRVPGARFRCRVCGQEFETDDPDC